MRFTTRCSGWVLALIARHGLVKGERIGVDGDVLGLDPRMEANAALRTIVRRETGETYREMLKHMAAESGVDVGRRSRSPRSRPGGKRLANADRASWTIPTPRSPRRRTGRPT
jgi:hypothetical protein